MTISAYGSGAYCAARPQEFVSSRTQLDALQQQLVTQKKSDSYAGLGADRTRSLDLNAKVATLDGWLANIERADVGLKLASQAVESFATMTSEALHDSVPGSYVASAGGRSAPQILAEERLKQSLDLLGSEVNGRYLFSGRAADVSPTVSYETMMEGDSSGRAGLKQLIAERKLADLGSAGLGRLVAGGTGTTATVTEEAANLPYGFGITGASASGTGLAASHGAGPPANVSVSVTAQPQAGDKLSLRLALPDGTEEVVVLTARAPGVTGDAATGFTIGADAAETAANLRASLGAAIGKEARTSLSAASAQIAAGNFFAGSQSSPPLRVPGPDFANATTAPVAGTAADTVIWYRGDDGAGPARATSTVQLDQNQSVGMGARANEEAFRTGLAQFAVMAAETFPAGDADSAARYDALAARVQAGLGYGGGAQKPAEIIVDLGTAQAAISQAKERHQTTKGYYATALDGVENVTTEEVATQILALQTRLQASYQVTSILSQLSLAQYI